MNKMWKPGMAAVSDIAAWSNHQTDEHILGTIYHGLAHVASGMQAAAHLGAAAGQKLRGNEKASQDQLKKAKAAGISSASHLVKGAAALVPGGGLALSAAQVAAKKVAPKAFGEDQFRKWSMGWKDL